MSIFAKPLEAKEESYPLGDTGDYDGMVVVRDAAGREFFTVWNPTDEQVEETKKFVHAVNGIDGLVAALRMARSYANNTRRFYEPDEVIQRIDEALALFL